jgi:hypothetical protein
MENSSQIFLAISEIFEKLPKENNRPVGENSPNLVTLTVTEAHRKVVKGVLTKQN